VYNPQEDYSGGPLSWLFCKVMLCK